MQKLNPSESAWGFHNEIILSIVDENVNFSVKKIFN